MLVDALYFDFNFSLIAVRTGTKPVAGFDLNTVVACGGSNITRINPPEFMPGTRCQMFDGK